MSHFDVIVIGTGPGGEGAAMRLAKAGKRVAVVEKQSRVGGACTHQGTIPSKSLRRSIQMLSDYRKHPLFMTGALGLELTWPQMLQSADVVIDRQVQMRQRYFARNQVSVIHGTASFTDPHQISVALPGGTLEQLSADNFVIATGSRPYRPPGIDFGHPRVLDSDTVLQLAHTPRSVTIYGAGVIGSEYASIFANLDVKVNLINTRDRLMAFLDDEITDALSYHLREQGVLIAHNETFASIETSQGDVALHCESGKRFRSDVLLWANGRTGNSGELNLDAVGLAVNSRGQIEVNERFASSQPHVYAVGDVAGPPGLASASYDQGRFVGTLIAEGECDWHLVEDIPTGIYTNPEISCLGRSERELTEQKIPYEVGRAEFKNVSRAQIEGRDVGMLKLLFHRDTLALLGIHCFGAQAAEILHIGQAIMSQQGEANTLRYFAETTFNYPTMAEGYRVAAINGLNRLG